MFVVYIFFDFSLQYKKLARDKSMFNSGAKFAKKKRVLNILKEEHANVLTDLNVATSSTNAKKNDVLFKNIADLIRNHEEFELDTKREKKYLDELDYQVKMVSNRIIELGKQQVTDEQLLRRHLEGQQTVDKLENKLHTVMQSFGTIQAKNRALRDQIDHYLHERMYFNKLWNKYVVQLSKGKKIMMDLIEQSTIAYDQREEWCQSLQALRIKAHNDLILDTEEMCHMQHVIDHSGKLEEFLETKNRKRIMMDLECKLNKKREEEMKKLLKAIENYEQILNEAKENLGEEDLDQAANNFLLQEEENFSKFQYAVELNRQMEELSQRLNHYRNRCIYQRSLNDAIDNEQIMEIEDLKRELEERTVQADEAYVDYDKTSSYLLILLNGIEKLFKICNFFFDIFFVYHNLSIVSGKTSNAPILELLGDNIKLSKFNALLYLTLLEARVNDLLVSALHKQKTGKKKDGVIIETKGRHPPKPLESFAPSSPCPLCIESVFCTDVIDSLQSALNKDEAEEKLDSYLALPDPKNLVHNVSACNLPKSRQIMQRRYQ